MAKPKKSSDQTNIFELLEKPSEAQKKSLNKVLDKLKEAHKLVKAE